MEIRQSFSDPLPLSDHPHYDSFYLFFTCFIHDFLRSIMVAAASCLFAVQLLEESHCLLCKHQQVTVDSKYVSSHCLFSGLKQIRC